MPSGKTLTGSIYGSTNPKVNFQKIASLGESGILQFEPLVDRTMVFLDIHFSDIHFSDIGGFEEKGD